MQSYIILEDNYCAFCIDKKKSHASWFHVSCSSTFNVFMCHMLEFGSVMDAERILFCILWNSLFMYMLTAVFSI